MSIRAVKMALDTDITPPCKKLVLLKFAWHCNDDGGSLFLSMATIAKAAGVSESQARRYVRSLGDDGVLSVVANAGGGSPGTVPHYRLDMPKLQAMATGGMGATPCADATPSTDARAGMDDRGGVAPMRETGCMGDTQSVINCHLKVSKEDGAHSDPAGSGDAGASPTGFANTTTELWAAGKALLMAQGLDVKQAGSFIGRLLSKYEEPATLEAVRSAVAKQPADARSYLAATAKSFVNSPRAGVAKGSTHSGFDKLNYSEGFGA